MSVQTDELARCTTLLRRQAELQVSDRVLEMSRHRRASFRCVLAANHLDHLWKLAQRLFWRH